MLKPVRVYRKHLQASRPSALRDPEPCPRQAVSDERRTASNSRLRCPLCNRSEATSKGLYHLGRWTGPMQPRQSPRQYQRGRELTSTNMLHRGNPLSLHCRISETVRCRHKALKLPAARPLPQRPATRPVAGHQQALNHERHLPHPAL
jgi:hypothetical protein